MHIPVNHLSYTVLPILYCFWSNLLHSLIGLYVIFINPQNLHFLFTCHFHVQPFPQFSGKVEILIYLQTYFIFFQNSEMACFQFLWHNSNCTFYYGYDSNLHIPYIFLLLRKVLVFLEFLILIHIHSVVCQHSDIWQINFVLKTFHTMSN